MSDTTMQTYRTQPGETFAGIARKLGVDPVKLYLQNTDAPLVGGAAGDSATPQESFTVHIDFFARRGERLDEIAQRLHVTHAFLFSLVNPVARLRERQSDSWHWYEIGRGINLLLNANVTLPRDPIAGGVLLYMPDAERPIRDAVPFTETAAESTDAEAGKTVVAGPSETFEEIAERAGVDPVALYLRNAAVPLLRRKITIPLPDPETWGKTRPVLPTHFKAPANTPLADIATTLGVTEAALIGTYPEMKIFVELKGGERRMTLSEPFVFEPVALEPSRHKATIAFEAKEGEHLEAVARRLGVDQNFLSQIIYFSPDGHALRETNDIGFTWTEFRRDVSFFREVTVEIPQDFIPERTILSLPPATAKPATAATTYTVLTPETFAEAALRLNVYEDELRRMNPDVQLLPRSTNPSLKEYQAQPGTLLDLIAKELQITTEELFQIYPGMKVLPIEDTEDVILTAPFLFRRQDLPPEMGFIPPNTTLTLPRERTFVVQGFTTFADAAQRLGIDVLALYLMNASIELERRSTPPGHPSTAKAIKTTIAFEAKKGESPEDVAERIGIDSRYIWEIINRSDPDIIEIKSEFAFSWAEFSRDVSFSREVTVEIPQDFIPEGTALALPKAQAPAAAAKSFAGIEEQPEEDAAPGAEDQAAALEAMTDGATPSADTTPPGGVNVAPAVSIRSLTK